MHVVYAWLHLMGVQEISELSYNRQPPLASIVSLQPVELDRPADQKAAKLGADNAIGSDAAVGASQMV